MAVESDTFVLRDKERKLIEYLRNLPFGEVTVIMHNGEPDRVENIKEKVKL